MGNAFLGMKDVPAARVAVPASVAKTVRRFCSPEENSGLSALLVSSRVIASESHALLARSMHFSA
jgi:hypothetical protein